MQRDLRQRAHRFLARDVWRIRTRELPRGNRLLVKTLKVTLLAARGFRSDKIDLRASALTLYSLISLVPVVALAFGVAKGFGYEQTLQRQLIERVPQQEVVLAQVIDFAQRLLAQTRGGLVAGVGVLVLIWTVMKVLGNIERSFNDIWRITKSRPLIRKLSDYLSLMFVCPVLLILSSSATVVFASELATRAQGTFLSGLAGTAAYAVLSLTPWVFTWVLFTFIYVFMPNTKVRMRSALWAGLLMGTVYQFVQWGYVELQVGVARYNAIYGSFAALPLFLVWLQVSWLLVLFGAEVSFAHQNYETYEYGPEPLNVSFSARKLLALRVMHALAGAFVVGDPPLPAEALSQRLEIPIRLTRRVLSDLRAAGLASEVRTGPGDDAAYQPGRDPVTLTIGEVVRALEEQGTDDPPGLRHADSLPFSEALEEFRAAATDSPANRRLTEI